MQFKLDVVQEYLAGAPRSGCAKGISGRVKKRAQYICPAADYWQEKHMYQKILVAYDGSPESRSALHECIHIEPPSSAEIHLLAVFQLSAYGMAGGYAPEVECAAKMQAMEQELASGRALMAAAGLNVATHPTMGEPVDVIGALADQLGI